MKEYLDEILLAAVDMARQAGQIHLRHFRSGHLGVEVKKNEADIVTIADKESERVILDAIHRLYPGHAILSEESGDDGTTADFQWVVDPLDGTTNYTAGLPVFSVSIGVKYRGERVVGVVYDAYTDELFTAVRGEGAMLNGRPIHVRDNDRLERAVVSMGFPVDKKTNSDNNSANFLRVLPETRAMRRIGSAAIDLCYVAAGFLDAYVEFALHEWDVCAGLLILEEAGGRYKDFHPSRPIAVLAASAAIFPKIEPLVR